MLNLQELIQGIHDAVLVANDSLSTANLNLIEKYFDLVPKNENANNEVEALRTQLHSSLANAKNSTNADESLKNILEAFGKYQDKSEEANSQKDAPPSYRAKNVVLQYPHRTEAGFEMLNINVPLIALVPISMSEVSEVIFKTNFEVLYDGNEIKVGFPPVPNTKVSEVPNLLDSKVVTNASLEIKLTPNRGANGLQKLIEGYEQVLRSQLPN